MAMDTAASRARSTAGRSMGRTSSSFRFRPYKERSSLALSPNPPKR